MISIIVPCYNETQTIGSVISRLMHLPFVKEIIIVDDNSTDGTQEFLRNIPFPFFGQVIYHPVNLGKGMAIRSGLAIAKGDIIVIQDADMEYDIYDLREVLKPLLEDKADAVYGSRFNGSLHNMSRLHWLGNKVLTGFTNQLTGLNLTDMETGCKAFKAEAIKSLELTQNRFGFEPEVTIKLAKKGYRIVEVPISYSARSKAEGKKLSWWDGFNALFCIFKYA